MRREPLACAAILLLSACGSSTKPESTAVATKASPSAHSDDRLYLALRAGTYQANAALEAIRNADDLTKPLSNATEGEAKDALLELMDSLDTAGRALADHVEEPDKAKVAADFAAADDGRLDAIDDMGKAKDELGHALDVAEELEKVAPPELKETHAQISGFVKEAIDAVDEGVGELKKVGG